MRWKVSACLLITLPCIAICADYPTGQRIQISEPCPKIAKWLSQGLASGIHPRLLKYDADLGLLTLSITPTVALSRSEARQYVEDSSKAKGVHALQVIFTLRSLVTGTLSFGDAQNSTAGSCTISTAFKFADKNGAALPSNGKMESELLKSLQDRCAQHGLDY